VNLPIETGRLRLRRYEDRDLADIVKFTRDADFWLARNISWPATEEGVREYWETQRGVEPDQDPKWFDLVIELKADGRAVGSVGLGFAKVGDFRQGTIGWLLGKGHRGQGVATEAVRALLAAGFIFTFHFFNVHFRPDKFPMDKVMFSGRLSKAELLSERKKLYDRWVAEGTLEKHRAGHEWDAWKKIALPAGFLAFMFGVALMLLIYFAMASRLTGE